MVKRGKSSPARSDVEGKARSSGKGEGSGKGKGSARALENGARHVAATDQKPRLSRPTSKTTRGRRTDDAIPAVRLHFGALSDRYYPSAQLDDLTDVAVDSLPMAEVRGVGESTAKFDRKAYERELTRLQQELVKMQYWIKSSGFRLIVLFEGRDAAGKGGTIKRITEPLNPRGCRVVALGTPSDQQKSQWYFQRYVEHFPSAGEIVIFDRSWYNRAGVERVMGFCSEAEVEEFAQSCPEFERMLVRSGIVLLKYWFSVSDEEQEARFQARIDDPTRRWKLSPMDLEARDRWIEFSQAKDDMFAHTNIPEAPWFTVEADDKRRARLNTIHHLLSKVPYTDMTPPKIALPPRRSAPWIDRPPINERFFVPNCYP